jgi:hypothetical protein
MTKNDYIGRKSENFRGLSLKYKGISCRQRAVRTRYAGENGAMAALGAGWLKETILRRLSETPLSRCF